MYVLAVYLQQITVKIFSMTMPCMHPVKTVMMFLMPAILTMVSLTTQDKEDDQAWMKYWVVISIFSVLELPLESLSVLPFYNTVKLSFILWCLTPGHFSGSELIFGLVGIWPVQQQESIAVPLCLAFS